MDELTWFHAPQGDVALQGAHVTRWRASGEDVLFLSARSRFERGQPIRGGVPVIFPWFGDDPEGRGRPAHGFARRLPWRLVSQERGERVSRASLELTDDAGTRALWPRRFALRLEVELGDALDLALTVENRSDGPFSCENALHTYLRVGDVRRITVRGLEGATWLDKLDEGRARRESGPVVFTGEVDRVYPGNAATVRVEDPVLARVLTVAKEGSRSTIVWNPWIEKAARLSDLGDDEWTGMVCIESGNVGADALTLASGATHTMRVRITRGT